MANDPHVDDGDITKWRSVVTLLVFIITSAFLIHFPLIRPDSLPSLHRYRCPLSFSHSVLRSTLPL